METIRNQAVKLLCMAMAVILAFSAAACAQSEKTQTSEGGQADAYHFESYKSDDIYDIEKLSLGAELEAKCESYRFTYLSDGYEIEGYISLPKETVETQKPCKVLIYNRGGNNHYGELEDATIATLCSVCDRVVIGSQYRGGGKSNGKDQLGGDDLHDVIKLIDFCEERFTFADMDDFCVSGASRGGMMTYMAARQDKRIKRIISVSGVSDLFQSCKEREDMREATKDCIGSYPEDAPEEYKKRSAVYWADEIKVPVLLIHSKGDKQVSYKQAEDIYAKLKDHTDCTFITHEDDVHGTHPEDFEAIKKFINS